MKTIIELRRIIAETESGVKLKSAKQIKKDGKLNSLCRMCVQYLETNSRLEFLQQEVERLNNRVEQIKAGYKDWIKANPYDHASLKDPKKAYENSVDLPLVRKQIRTIKFILE